MRATRRDVLAAATALAASGLLPGLARALEATPAQPADPQPPLKGSQEPSPPESHGLSSFGDLGYPADFKHFRYVNPDAPKGGTVTMQISTTRGNQAFDTFDTLNIWVLKGNGAAGMTLTVDSLMARALDEPDALYGLVAKSVSMSEDGLEQTFRLRPEARFSDGSRLTADDVAFSFNMLRAKGHPLISQAIRMMDGARAMDEGTLVVRYAQGRPRSLPLTVAALPIFSKAWFSGRDFEAATLEAPLGSGPYAVERFEQGRFVAFARRPDYWAKDLPVNVGINNFDRIRFEYFRDRDVAFEGFKGGLITFREEFTSRIWARGYDFPAIKDGKVIREVIPDETPSGSQGWFMNTRRPAFADMRVRQALGQLFDFEWTNTNLMFGAYRRTTSFFENSEMAATGTPGPAELALLEPFRGKVPEAVFGPAYLPPVTDGSGQDRALLRKADALLREAGCKRQNNALLRPDGQPFTVEFLDFSEALEPHTGSLIKNMKLLGIAATFRSVDPAQYQRRTDSFDYDIISRRFALPNTPGDELEVMYSSRTASVPGSSNIAGIQDPVVDALLAAALGARDRPSLVAACRALDRVLRAGHYWIPMWTKPEHWLAYWDMFGKPPVKPKYDRGAPGTWWYDEAKAQRIGKAG